jgi:Na+-transporting NADH:ubiquinone oxidoreductase subunit NqrE
MLINRFVHLNYANIAILIMTILIEKRNVNISYFFAMCPFADIAEKISGELLLNIIIIIIAKSIL